MKNKQLKKLIYETVAEIRNEKKTLHERKLRSALRKAKWLIEFSVYVYDDFWCFGILANNVQRRGFLDFGEVRLLQINIIKNLINVLFI